MSSLLSDNESFWLSFITIMSGIIAISIRYCYYSKCKNVKCFCIQIDRDVEREVEEKEFEISHNVIRNENNETKLSV